MLRRWGRSDARLGSRAGGPSLAWKLVLLLAGVFVATAAILLFVSDRLSRADAERALRARVERAAKGLATQVAAEPVRSPETLRALVSFVERAHPTWDVTVLRGADAVERGNDVDVVRPVVEASAPAPPPAEGLVVRVRASLAPGLAEENRELLFTALLALLGVIGAAAGVYLGVDRLVLAPIRRLARPMAEMAAGGPYEPVEPHGNDEMALLTAQVNGVVAALMERESESRDAAAMLRLVREAVPDVVYRYDLAAEQFEFVSDAVAGVAGRTREELVRRRGASFDVLVAPDDLPRVRAERDAHLARGPGAGTLVREFRVRRADGVERWVEDHAVPEFHADGRPARLSGVLRDVTTQREAERALRRSEELTRCVADTALVAMITADDHGTLLSANPAAGRMLGRDPPALVGTPVEELLPVRRRAAFRDALARYASKGVVPLPGRPLEIEVLGAEGREVPLELSIGVASTPDGRVFTGVARDLSQQRAVEAQLLQAQKMEAVGTLAGGIAHDFNNMLSVIVGHAELARGRDATRVDAAIDAVVAAAQRASDLTARLLGFARQSPPSMRPVDVGTVVRRTLDLVARSFERTIDVGLHVASGLPAISADGSQVEHALMNLCLNARDAMPKGGSLSVTASLEDVEASRPSLPAGCGPGRYVRIAVSDTGVGMTPEVRARLFEPFFTTKERGRGTGLGLAMVYGIVRAHGGFVEVESEPGRGATFRLFLPPTDEPVPEEPDAAPTATGGGREAILVVDDDDYVRPLIARMLGSYGYATFTAADGPTALEVLDRQGEIALVVLDMMLPGMGGAEVFRAMRARRPTLPVLLSTGYSERDEAQELLAQGCDGMLKKPYLPSDLARTVRGILDRPKPQRA